jgi:hypothetical protein
MAELGLRYACFHIGKACVVRGLAQRTAWPNMLCKPLRIKPCTVKMRHWPAGARGRQTGQWHPARRGLERARRRAAPAGGCGKHVVQMQYFNRCLVCMPRWPIEYDLPLRELCPQAMTDAGSVYNASAKKAWQHARRLSPSPTGRLNIRKPTSGTMVIFDHAASLVASRPRDPTKAVRRRY